MILDIDENIKYNKSLKKEITLKEYLFRAKKTRLSELSGINKAITHKTFATPAITPQVGIIHRPIDFKNKSTRY